MEGLTFDQLIGASAVVLVLIGAYNTISTAMKNRKEQKADKNAPVSVLSDRLDKHDSILAADKRRIENLEEITQTMKEHDKHLDDGMMVLMRSTLAMSRHMQHGNNIDGLKTSEKEITDYLTGK